MSDKENRLPENLNSASHTSQGTLAIKVSISCDGNILKLPVSKAQSEYLN